MWEAFLPILREVAEGDFILDGETTYTYTGSGVDSAGDYDGDGIDDLVIGANYESSAASAAGAVYVVAGGTSGSGSLASARRIDGNSAADYLGWAVEGAGDVDGDGLSDLLVGAPGAYGDMTGTGVIWLLTSESG